MPAIVLAADGPTQIGLRARERRRRWLRAHSTRLLSHPHPIARTVACGSRLDTLCGSSHACSSESPPACHTPCVPTLRRTSAGHIPHLTVHCTTPCPRPTLRPWKATPSPAQPPTAQTCVIPAPAIALAQAPRYFSPAPLAHPDERRAHRARQPRADVGISLTAVAIGF